MIPAPPKVWPLPKLELPLELLPELELPADVVPPEELAEPELSVPLALPLLLESVPDDDCPLPVSDEPKVELLELNELLPNELLPDELLPNELLPNELPLEVVLAADPPDGPIPASVDALPDSGWPKNPIAVGVLFCPNITGFQSSWPVSGSLYFLRRNLMLLVSTSACTLGG